MNRILRRAAGVVALTACVSCVFDSHEDPDLASQSFAATLPIGFVEEQVASGIVSPTAMQFAPDGRLFVCGQKGALRVIKNGQLLSTPFVNLTVNSSGERGLLGVAFDPQFATNRFVYVYYTTATTPVHNRLSRFTANGDVAVAGSEQILLELPALNAQNHNGGAIHFGLDGRLYVAVGDNAKGANAPSLSTLFGKILRLNADGTIPTDNPFYNTATGVNRAIWATGLRNPFTFGIHPTSGRMFINDVGEGSWEEINEGQRGANYGWPATEGPTTQTQYRSPLYAYSHSGTTTRGCSVIGSAFYVPKSSSFPAAYVGDYFFADYCSGWIKYLDLNSGNALRDFATGIKSPVDLKVGPDGALYYLTYGGAVFRIRYTASQAPVITTHPASKTVPAGEPTSFSVTASGSAPLAYQWQRNNVTIPGATSSTYNFTPTTSDSGASYRCRVSNSYGVVYSTSAILTVLANQAPVANITSPANGTTYAAGTAISYSGTGTDNEDGTLPASAFTWRVDFHHDDHVHPFEGGSGMTNGTFTPATTGHAESNVWYRVHLSVQDSAGFKNEVFRDIYPRTANMTFQTQPSGLEITLDGQPRTTPFTITGVTGVQRTLGVTTPQTLNGQTYTFSRWSDGGAATHDIATPTGNTTYTATFNGGSTTPPGNGVRGEYFDNMDFTASRLTRTDPNVAFRWGPGAPASGIGPDTFSVRWTGRIQPQYTETYTFYLVSDQAARLWINGQLLIDAFAQHTEREDRGNIALTAGQMYDIRVDYFDNTEASVIKLSWSSPRQVKQYVPRERLFTP